MHNLISFASARSRSAFSSAALSTSSTILRPRPRFLIMTPAELSKCFAVRYQNSLRSIAMSSAPFPAPDAHFFWCQRRARQFEIDLLALQCSDSVALGVKSGHWAKWQMTRPRTLIEFALAVKAKKTKRRRQTFTRVEKLFLQAGSRRQNQANVFASLTGLPPAHRALIQRSSSCASAAAA